MVTHNYWIIVKSIIKLIIPVANIINSSVNYINLVNSKKTSYTYLLMFENHMSIPTRA